MNILKATKRTTTSAGQINKLRSEGFIPAVLYGGKQDNLKISLKKLFLKDLIKTETFMSKVFDLDIDGNSEKALQDKGAKDIYVYITHAVLSGQAINKIEKSQIKKLITTDTIDNSKKIRDSKKIEIISLAPMISEAMKRIANSTSVSSLFK